MILVLCAAAAPTGAGAAASTVPVAAHPGGHVHEHAAAHGGLDLLSMEQIERRAASADAPLAPRQDPVVPVRPELHGQWSAVIDTPVVPVSATLLSTGQVLMWDSVGDRPTERYEDQSITRAALWDPTTGTSTRVDLNGTNIFCSGFAHMADGRVFVAGGNGSQTLDGTRTTHIFDPQTATWTRGPDMAVERWYPSVAALPNGEHLIMGGGSDPVNLHEVRRLDGNLRALTGARVAQGRLYPFIQSGVDGDVVYFGPQKSLRLLDATGTGALRPGPSLDFGPNYGGYAMFDVGRTIITGGADSRTATTIVEQAPDGTLTLTAGADLLVGRRQHDTTVLADGSVMVHGGNSSGAYLLDLAHDVRTPEIWDPASDTWTLMAPAQRSRQYHSTSLLLPDGRVLTGGGGICVPCERDGYLEKNVEVFSPPYLFDADGNPALRPEIAAAPDAVEWGSTFSVSTPDAARIAAVALVRLGAATHGQDQGQRYVPLSHVPGVAEVTVRAPATSATAPPGPYMLFLIDDAGVPSIAAMVTVGSVEPPGSDAPGLRAEYFDATTPAGAPLITRNEAVDFDWGAGPPAEAMPLDGFSVRWSGRVTIPASGDYRFRAVADDGVRLWLDGRLLIDRWTSGGVTVHTTSPLTLAAGSSHDLRMEYRDEQDDAVVRLRWIPPGQSHAETIPAVALSPERDPDLPGLLGEYFVGTEPDGQPVLVQNEWVNFGWGQGPPASGLPSDSFSARWTGRVTMPVSGSYRFQTRSDDGIRVWVDGELVIDNWTTHRPTTDTSAPLDFDAGSSHDLRVEYFEGSGGAVARLRWILPGETGAVVVPLEALRSGGPPPAPPEPVPGTGLRGQYFAGATLSGAPVLVREEAVAFGWGTGAPPGLPSDDFSARWTGQVTAPVSGDYRVQTRSDDGVRVWVDGALVIDNWTTHRPTTDTSAPLVLAAGSSHDLRMEYFEGSGSAVARLRWILPDETEAVIIPISALSLPR